MSVSREEWLDLFWQLEGGKGEPRGNDRKRLLSRLRTLGSSQPGIASQDRMHDHMARWLETMFHSAHRPEVRERLKRVPLGRRYAYMPKPWKGRAGNQARTAKRAAKSLSRAEQARALRDEGRTKTKIAEELGVTERQVRRYLTGR